MTASSDRASEAPGSPLYAAESHETPSVGTERRPGGLNGPQTGAQSLDRSRRYLAPVARLDLPDQPDVIHLSVYEWLPGFQEWATGPALCGYSTTQGALPVGTQATCAGCLDYQPRYERSLGLGDWDGCARACRKPGVHTLVWGECAHARESEPTLSISRVYADTDGHPAIGFDTYTAQELADLIAPALITPEEGFALPYDEDYGRALALEAARAIFRRNDPQPDQP
jgi:hypothetical protein